MRGDDGKLRQVLVNLLGNAVKFTETTESRSGLVRLNVTLAEPVRDGRAQLRFEIGDNGIGMSAETVAGLFQPFTQGETSTTRRFGGTGLGLSICKSLVVITSYSIHYTKLYDLGLGVGIVGGEEHRRHAAVGELRPGRENLGEQRNNFV